MSEWKPRSSAESRLQPYAFNRWTGNDNALAAAWLTLGDPNRDASVLHRQLMRHLLFYDALAAPDPFLMYSGSNLRPRIHGMLENLEACRAWAAAAIKLVDVYRDLIVDQIVEIIPAQPELPGLSIAVSKSVPYDVEGFPTPPADWWGMSPAQVAALDIVTQLASASGVMDPYLPTTGHRAVLRKLVDAADPEIQSAVGNSSPNADGALLPSVLRCELPDPDGISISDVVAIRRDGHFDGWRRAVARGVHEIHQAVGPDLAGWRNVEAAQRRSIFEQVRLEAEQPRNAIGWFKNPTVDVSFDIVLVSASAAAAFANPAFAAALGSLELAKLVATQVERWRFARGTYGRHVAMFEPRD